MARSVLWCRVVRLTACSAVLATMVAASPSVAAVANTTDGRCASSAADVRRWGEPDNRAEFTTAMSLDAWHLYDSVGHAGNGVRTPEAIRVDDGVMTITGDAVGNSDGMAWLPGQLYGRWEVCMQTPAGSANYHPVALLWPDSEIWPGDGEIDFAEIVDPARQIVTASVHYRADGDPPEVFNPMFNAKVAIDATQWHSWAVEWTPDRVTGYVDGAEWFEVAGRSPRGPMHLCLQLDNFGGDISQGGQQSVDWARQYPL